MMNDMKSARENDLLLVIDVQNAYGKEGPWTCPRVEEATDSIISLIESGTIGNIIFTRFDAPKDPKGAWKDYNEINREVNEDPYMNEIAPRLKEYSERYPLYSKSTYSSLTVPEVKKAVEECRERGGALVVSGVVSECCVIATALAAIDMGCPLIYIRDACAGIDELHEKAVEDIISALDYVHTAVLDKDEYLNRNQAGR